MAVYFLWALYIFVLAILLLAAFFVLLKWSRKGIAQKRTDETDDLYRNLNRKVGGYQTALDELRRTTQQELDRLSHSLEQLKQRQQSEWAEADRQRAIVQPSAEISAPALVPADRTRPAEIREKSGTAKSAGIREKSQETRPVGLPPEKQEKKSRKEQVRELFDQGHAPMQIARELGISITEVNMVVELLSA